MPEHPAREAVPTRAAAPTMQERRKVRRPMGRSRRGSPPRGRPVCVIEPPLPNAASGPDA